MSTNAADTLNALKQPLEHKDVLISIPGLAWQVPRLEDAVTAIERAIAESPTSGGPVVEALRKEALGYDRVHDVGQRYVVRSFELALVELEGADRRTVVDAQARLCPLGLGVTQLPFAQQASQVEVQALQASRDDVRAGLEIVAGHAPKARQYLEAAISAGRSLGKTLDAVEKALAGSTAGSVLFEARRAGHAVLAYFRDTVEQLYPAGTPDNDKVRSDLIGRYERLLAALLEEARSAKMPEPEPAPA